MKNEKSLSTAYEVILALLSLTVILLLIVELSYDLDNETTLLFNVINNIILLVFIIDYMVRFYLAENKKKFFRSNIIDLIAIIPFNSAFQAARLLGFTKILKFTYLFKFLRILRIISLLLKLKKHLHKFIRTNNFHYMLVITFLTLLIGTLGIYYTEGLSLGNSLWWSFVTITTVGYGDISPSTPIGRVLASILMLVGIGFLSMLTGTIATFFLKKNSTSYKDETIQNICAKLENFDELTEEDIENIHKTLLALKR
ncbi:potassium channel family protein [Clostridium sp. 'White wine YQ']|uniref:potassium channel family protein n=1 Tax=Clostridium sp. 'White wine YQ' TaxID=3027474 RepID=UPI00236597F0|nr:potassium channel family protein [Clostridium sp. 'White wine YQ']MDD7793726.1 potassium channel family protein [Clostridium sp. 'White wine YQ']